MLGAKSARIWKQLRLKREKIARSFISLPFRSNTTSAQCDFPANVPRNVVNGSVDNDPSCLFFPLKEDVRGFNLGHLAQIVSLFSMSLYTKVFTLRFSAAWKRDEDRFIYILYIYLRCVHARTFVQCTTYGERYFSIALRYFNDELNENECDMTVGGVVRVLAVGRTHGFLSARLRRKITCVTLVCFRLGINGK